MKIISTASLITAGLLTSGCIGGGGGGVTASTAPQVVSSFVTVLSSLPTSGANLSLPAFAGGISTASVKVDSKTKVAKSKTPTRNVAAGGLNSCTSFTPDPGTDADGDQIAAEKNYTFDCSGNTDGGNTYTWKGTMKITDKNDTGGAASQGRKGGYRYEFNMPEYSWEGADGNVMGFSHTGFWDVTGTDTTTNYLSDYTGGTKATWHNIPNLGTVNVDYTYHHKFNGSITHNVGWTSGSMTYTGDYSWNGTFLDESAQGQHRVMEGNANMTIRSEGLTFDSTCAKYYQSGSWILVDNNGAEIKITYACTSAKAYFNGTEITVSGL